MPADGAGPPDLVIEVTVAGAAAAASPGRPDGQLAARYQVAFWGPRAVLLHGRDATFSSDVRLHADYATLVAIASGAVPPVDAMFSGGARVAGSTAALSAYLPALEALDLVPPSVRLTTTF